MCSTHIYLLTIPRQLADKLTCGQLSHGLVNSRSSQHEMFDRKSGVNNHSKYDFGWITLFVHCQYLAV